MFAHDSLKLALPGLQQTTVLLNVRVSPMLDQCVFTPERLTAVEATPALLKQ